MANLEGYTGLLSPPDTPKFEMYGGIKKDLKDVQTYPNEFNPFLIGFWGVEFTLTLIGDSLSLPICILKTLEKKSEQSPAEMTNPPTTAPTPTSGNALIDMADNNKPQSWTLSRRINMPLASNSAP